MRKVSIITVCFNSAKTILKCIDSVNAQEYSNIEHIFIDGGSSDDTLQKIHENAKRKPKIISEPDDGIYDAMNKGLYLASGELIMFLNSDDSFADPNALKLALCRVDNNHLVIFSAISYQIHRRNLVWKPTMPNKLKILFGWNAPHPGFIANTKYLREAGGFDTSIRITADIDLIIRCVLKLLNTPNAIKVNTEVLTIMDPTGESSKLSSMISGNLDFKKICEKNKILTPWFIYIIFRILPKIHRKLKLFSVK